MNISEFPFLHEFTEWFIPTDDDFSLSALEFREHKTRILDEIEALRTALATKDRRGVIHHALTLSGIVHYTQLRMGLEDAIHPDDMAWISYVIGEVIARKMELYE